MLNVIMLSVIMLNVIMLSVVALFLTVLDYALKRFASHKRSSFLALRALWGINYIIKTFLSVRSHFKFQNVLIKMSYQWVSVEITISKD